MRPRHPVIAVIGSGFGGTLLALALRRRGHRVVLLERGAHPRFAVGESTTPLTNLLVEEIAEEFNLPFLRPLAKWGTWQAAYPALAGGVKRGFTFYHHTLGRRFPRRAAAARARQLMVGASPTEAVADTHWYRPELDAWLVGQAVDAGVEFWEQTDVEAAAEGRGGMRLAGRRGGRPFELRAAFVVDASGPRGCLHRLLRLPEGRAAGFPRTSALFAHFSGVDPLAAEFSPGEPPYPAEQAAVHHLFDGGWLWMLRFNNGLTSAGVVATQPAVRRLGLGPGPAGWRRVLAALPSVRDAFARAHPVTPFFWQPQVAFQSGRVHGRRWALLPSAAGVIDPLLSTGFPLTLLGVQRLGRILRGGIAPGLGRGLRAYGAVTTREFERTAALVRALYRRLGRFEDFRELSLAYFASASFAEATRRLGKAATVPEYLLGAHPTFAARLDALTASPWRGRRLRAKVREAIGPIDVLGLADDRRSPWYPAAARDLLENCGKLGATPAEVTAMLRRSGLEA